MAALTDAFDLGRLHLLSGQGRRFELAVSPGGFAFGRDHYDVAPDPVDAVLDVARMTGSGFALRLRFAAELDGMCMRCLLPAHPRFAVDAREVSRPGGGEELESPYLSADEVLDLRGWAHDALALALPQTIVCRPDCAGLCPECGANLNDEPGHAHERAPDPRWAKLRELELD